MKAEIYSVSVSALTHNSVPAHNLKIAKLVEVVCHVSENLYDLCAYVCTPCIRDNLDACLIEVGGMMKCFENESFILGSVHRQNFLAILIKLQFNLGGLEELVPHNKRCEFEEWKVLLEMLIKTLEIKNKGKLKRHSS
ncbi:hypothetical protein [Runella slithyformis]|uniref:Uncharacterized protein n=1 Tax=Runella slithyformis (strain ATCC 29530 / DSM 19594 / LMG 11500 / NCIMB 11436 / LSU 4) TaxID=761193 RepID=A0A7U3ZIX4_RUNSL|nr:hypothetical protein [Runella slithyformis]AEI48077.1 hypothetical protein Runsl_1652 [Runella slithyformis DSM 19594]